MTHIAVDHPEVPGPEVVGKAVENPDFILADSNRRTNVVSSLYYGLGLVGGRFRNMYLAVGG